MAEKNYKSATGVDEFYYGVLDGDVMTGLAPVRVKFVQNITVDMPQEAVRAYGDNRTAEIAVSAGNISVTGAFHTLPLEDKATLFGLEKSAGELYSYGSSDNPPYVAAVFAKTFEDGSKEWVGLAKGMFMRPSIEANTKEDSVDFSSEEITAEFMDREVDGFDYEKSVVFGRDAKGETAQRDALFTAVFGADYPVEV